MYSTNPFQLSGQLAYCPDHTIPPQEANMSAEAKCPFVGGARKQAVAGAPTNADWWPIN